MGSEESCCSGNRRVTEAPIEEQIGSARRKQHRSHTKNKVPDTEPPQRGEGIAASLDTAAGDTVMVPNSAHTPQKASWMTKKTPSTFYMNLAAFINQMPSTSRSHIWEHSVALDMTEHSRNQTLNSGQIKCLLSDSIIVYCIVNLQTNQFMFTV
eukprot:791587_1